MQVALAPDILINIGGVAISNSLLTAVFIIVIFSFLGLYANRRFALVPTRLQVALELINDYLMSQLVGAFRSKERARKFFPYIMTLLIFLLVANQLTIVPLIGQAVLSGKPLFRSVTSHLSATVALALLTLVIAHSIALYISPLKHLGNFIKIIPIFKARTGGEFANALLMFFLGLLDIVSEAAKVISLSFRLFGNIFGGELMILVIAGLSAYTRLFVPIPFLALSIFSGLIQAFVFTLLSIQFIAGTITAVSGEKQETDDKTAEEVFQT